MADPGEVLELIDKAAKSSRADMKAVIEGHLDASERVIANLSMLTTINDTGKLLGIVAADPTS